MKQSQAESICTLRVNINCCTMCELKAKEKLQKINGVESVAYDSKGMVTVSGKVNPMAILKKFEKWGKNAELLSFKKEVPNQPVPATPANSDKDPSCRCDAGSDSDGNADDRNARPANEDNANISWQNPDIPVDKPSVKSKGFLGLFRKKHGGGKKMIMVGKPPKWQIPKTPPMAEAGGSRPHYNRPFEPYPPPVIGRPPSAHMSNPFGLMPPPSAHMNHPFGLMPPPPPTVVPPPPQGFFNSKPPPKVNPMVHYTSYADNYSDWLTTA